MVTVEKNRAYQRKYWEKLKTDPVRMAAYRARKRATLNREKNAADSKQWRAENPEKVKAAKRRYYRKHKAAITLKNKKRYEKNIDVVKAQKREWTVRNRDRLSAKQKVLRLTDPEIFRRQREEFRSNNRPALMMYRAKRAAKDRGLLFDLDRQWFRERLERGRCEMTGLAFDMIGRRTPLSPSIDRINPRGGYTKSNCRLIIWWLNRAMSDQGEDFAMMVFDLIPRCRGLVVAA